MNKYFFVSFIIAAIVLVTPSCKKNNNQPPVPAEVQLIISTDASALNYTPGTSADFNLTVESAMPQAGVNIEFVVKGEIDNVVYYTSQLIETISKTTKVIINNLPKQKICICTITVTSKSKSTNFAITSFRVAYK